MKKTMAIKIFLFFIFKIGIPDAIRNSANLTVAAKVAAPIKNTSIG